MAVPSCRLLRALCVVAATVSSAQAELPNFEPQQLPTELGVGYAVRAVDMNADGRLDIAIVDSKRVLWLENPSWQEHIVYATPEAKFDNVCFAPHDVNGDGRVDFALGADWQFGNSDSGGTIGWIEHTPSGPWTYHPLDSEPTTHRMNWANVAGDGPPWLLVAPLKGRGTRPPGFDQQGIRLLAYQPVAGGTDWQRRVLTEELHVMHNFAVTDLDDNGQTDVVAASYEGLTWLTFESGEVRLRRLGSGQQAEAPKRGASEIRVGRLADGRKYLATVEPWHGDKIVVYVAPDDWQASPQLWPRTVIDDQLAWGHAVACADLDGDADEELVVGVRDDHSEQHRRGLRIYDPQSAGRSWERALVDPGGVAIEDLTTADLDDDGDQDIIAVGRQTHNVKIYWNQRVD